MNNMKKAFRYIGIGIGAIIVIWIVLIVSLYFVIDAEDVRKVTQDYFKQNTNAELQIKNLDLGFFPMLYIDMKEMKLISSLDKKELLYCKEAKLRFNVLSLIQGKPRLTLALQSPAIELIPNMGAVFSKTSGTAEEQAKAAAAQAAKATDAQKKSGDIKIPSYLVLSKVAVDIEDAALTYSNAVSSYSFKGIDLKVMLDLLTKTVDMDLLLPVDLKQGTMVIKGNLKTTAKIVSPDFKSANADVTIDATGLELTAGTVQKTKHMALVIKLDATADQNSLDIKDLLLTVLDQKIGINGKVTNLQTSPHLDLVIPQANINIESLKKLDPALSDQKISGSISLKGSVKGEMKPLPSYNLLIGLNNIEAVVPQAKEKIVANGTIAVNNSNVVLEPLNVNLGQSVIAIKGKVDNYMSNVVSTNISISSNLIDLSPFVPKPEKKKAEKKAEPASGGTAAKGGNEDFEVVKKDMITSMKPMLAKYPTTLTVNIKKIKLHETEAIDVKGGIVVNKEGVAAKGLSMKAMDGVITSEVAVLLNGEIPQVTGGLNISSINLSKAALLAMPDLKDAVNGTLSTKLNLNASGYTFLNIRKNLKANGDFSLLKFECNTASLNEMLKPKLESIPFLKDKVKLAGSKGLDKVTGTFHMEKERIYIDKFDGVKGDNELKGKGELTLDDYMDLYIESYTPFSSVPYEALKQPDGKVMIPAHLIGPVTKPRVDLPYTVKYITDKSIAYEKEKLINEAKQKAQQETAKLKEQVKQKAGSQLKNLIKGFKF